MDDTTQIPEHLVADDDAAIEAALAKLRESEPEQLDDTIGPETTPEPSEGSESYSSIKPHRKWLLVTLAVVGLIALGIAGLIGYVFYLDYQQSGIVPMGVTLVQAPDERLSGLNKTELEATLNTIATDLATQNIALSAAGTVVTLRTAEYVSFDVGRSVDLILNQRASHSWWEKAQHDLLGKSFEPTLVTLEGSINSQELDKFIDEFEQTVATKPKNATSKQVDGRIEITRERSGRTLQREVTASLVMSALEAQIKDGSRTARIEAPVTITKPKVTRETLEIPAIVVDLSAHTVKVYKGEHLEKTYRCATGAPGFPTPAGTFKIVAKRYLPTWINPAPTGWGSTMPERIAPGPSNPLGLRALNLNAPNIRIHGTQNIASIGTAASHGCIRLANNDVVDLYPRVEVGTKVYIIP